MSGSNSRRGMGGRDVITVGIFSAIYFAINFAFMLLGGLHPLLWILMPGFIALFTGIPYLMMCAKVQKVGSVLLMGLITGLIYFVTGQFTPVILVSFVIACGLGELVRGCTHYTSIRGNLVSFVLFSLGMVGSPLPIWLMREDFLRQITEQGMPADYVNTLAALSSSSMLVVLFLAPVVGAIIGGFIGCWVGVLLIFMVDWKQAIIFIIMFVVVQQFEGNIIYPHVVGNSVGLPAIWVLVAVTIGGNIAGIVGMIFSIPFCSVLYQLFSEIVNKQIKKIF